MSIKSRQPEKESFNNCCGILQCRSSNGSISFEAVLVPASGISQRVVAYFEYCNTVGHARAVHVTGDLKKIYMKRVGNFGFVCHLCHSDVN